GPWQITSDIQLNWRPSFWGLDQRLTLSMVTSNLLGGLDQLFHGNDLHGWGASYRPDATLLIVRGFDPVAQQYTYQVNQRFGDVRSAQALRQPFQIGVQLRFALGTTGFFGGGGAPGGGGGPRGGFGGGGFDRGGFGPGGARPDGPAGAGAAPGAAGAPPGDSAARFENRLARIMPDPVAKILEYSFQIKINDDQTAKLNEISQRFVTSRDSLGHAIQKEIEAAGPRPDPAVLFSALRGRIEAGRNLMSQMLELAHGVLTAEQWAALPEEAKTVRQAGPGGGFRRPQ
ncbi:MAG TPA: hypothetical protein VLD58_00710, partial [Gemmatimonadales bacterium]|nr:hypothetical protein [Gemmatimonadales bacterium]